MRKITQDDIKNINNLYLEHKTYAAVSRLTGFAPSTIKKYIIEDYKRVDERKIQKFNKPLPEFDISLFKKYLNDWGPLCELSESENEEIKILWEELEL